MNFESRKVYNDIKKQNKRIDYTKLVFNGSGKHHYNFTISLSLESFPENIYRGSFSLRGTKSSQKDKEDMIRSLEL